MKRFFAGLCLLACSLMASAAIDTYTFDSEAERERYRSLTEELRCPKCQNQNIADSNSPIAMDLRDEIYRMLQEGRGLHATRACSKAPARSAAAIGACRPRISGLRYVRWASCCPASRATNAI